MRDNSNMKIKLKLLLLALFALDASTAVRAQSTAFTYNGRLANNGVLATGSYDVRFAVYDANAAGNLVAGPLSFSPVGVTNGLFTVRLDFGAGGFTGPARWLQISVRA